MVNVSAKNVVRVFAGVRVALGVAFAVAPDRLSGGLEGRSSDTLMTRSFAVRELVLGVGGLLATTRADAPSSAVQMWAGLGALTDVGDLTVALVGLQRGEQAGRTSALVAAGGLLAELWAVCALARA